MIDIHLCMDRNPFGHVISVVGVWDAKCEQSFYVLRVVCKRTSHAVEYAHHFSQRYNGIRRCCTGTHVRAGSKLQVRRFETLKGVKNSADSLHTKCAIIKRIEDSESPTVQPRNNCSQVLTR